MVNIIKVNHPTRLENNALTLLPSICLSVARHDLLIE
jgi:hypothetical protein